MRRPLLLILYAQIALILLLYYVNPLGLGKFLDRRSTLSRFEGSVASAEGTVVKVSIKSYYTALTVDTGKEKILVRLKGLADGTDPQEDIRAYDLMGRRVSVTGKVSLPSGRRNPRCFDYRLYLKGQGVNIIMEVSRYRIVAENVTRPVTHYLSVQKGRFYAAVRPFMDDESFSVLAGLLFGDKNYMDDELYEQYQYNGIAHVLAVSGLHVGLLYALVSRLTGGGRTPLSAAVSLAVIYCYAALSSFSVSVLRASFMITLRIIAPFLKRRYDMVCAASATAIVFLLINPYQLFDSGFQMSFAAAYTMGIALPYVQIKFLKHANRKRNELLYRAGSFAVPVLVIQAGMLPLTTFHFLHFSPIGIIINPVAVALAGLILPAGLIPFILSFFLPRLFTAVAAGPAMVFIKVLSFGSRLADSMGLSFSVPAMPAVYVILYYIVFFWFFSETRIMLNRRHLQKPLAAVAFAIIALWIAVPKGYGLPDVCFIDVGQGDSTLISTGGYHILIDGGGSYFKNVGKDTLKPFLLKNGITSVDLAIVSHSDTDHSRGIYELAECFDVKRIIDEDRSNETCLVTYAEINGVRYLFMGDADINRELEILKASPGLECDVLKVGHHGSSTSTGEEFLKAVSPKFAVISCGLNNSYGHPSSRVVELLQKSGIIYGRTDSGGAVCVSSDGKDIKWHTQEDSQIRSIPLKR